MRTQVDDIKADIMTICGNPLPEIDELGLLSNTSAACADTLFGQSGAVYDSYKLCQQTVTEEIQKLDDYSQFQDQDFALTSQQDNVKKLWERQGRLFTPQLSLNSSVSSSTTNKKHVFPWLKP